MPHETGFNAADNPYTESEFFQICEDYRVPNDPMEYWEEKFYWTYQRGVHWPNDYIGPDSVTHWIIEKSVGFTDVGLLRILESVRAYAYLILSSQASARSSIIGNSASSLTAQSAFLNNFENVVNPNDPMEYWEEKFYWTYQRGVHWPNDYIGPDSVTHWIIEKSVGFTDVGLLRILESVRAYAYLILSSQASARSSIIGNSASSLTAQSAFLNNFENVVNRKVDIQEDVKRYQETLSYASSKVDYSVGENLFMLPSDMELRIRSRTVGYNNKILTSDGKFNLRKNDEVNSSETPAIKNHKTNSLETPAIKSHLNTTQGLTHAPAISHGCETPAPPAHENEKVVFILLLTGGFTVWFLF